MADCRGCAGCLDVVEGVRILCVNSHVEPVTWAEALHDRCDDFRPKTAPVVDCRECVHVCDVVDGKSFRCSVIDQSQIPWRLVASDPCNEFRPKPAPASPPASADREGADLLESANGAAGALDESANLAWDYGFSAIRDRCIVSASELRRAIAAEEARRARPAVEDPRDALLRQCATALAGFVEGWAVHGSSCQCHACRDGRAALASLRAAGVEPAPEAQEGKASR